MEPSDQSMSDDTDGSISKTSIRPAPVHPLSAVVTIALDGLWSVLEGATTLSVIGFVALVPIFMLMTSVTCFGAVFLIQRFVSHDGWGASFAKGVVMGIIAGVPYSVAGTATIGLLLLGWAGAHGIEAGVRKALPNPK
jgi:hypothetical protein